MKKTISKVCSLILSLVLVLAFAVTLTACGEEAKTHEHTFATTWESDATNHWHKATCEHTAEVSGKAAHTFNGDTCTVCNYKKAHEHTFETGWTYDETNHWHKATCEHTGEKSGVEAHKMNGKECTVCDYVLTVASKCKCDTPCMVCPECGGCIDTNCKNDACEKCGEGLKATDFEVEYAEWYDQTGAKTDPEVIDRADNPEKGGCVFVQGLGGAGGAKMVFKITVNKATDVTLKVRPGKNGKQDKFTNQMTVMINGEIFDSEAEVNAKKDPSEPAKLEIKRSFSYVNLGCIHLEEGENTIEIIAFSKDPTVGLNMDKITLLAPEDVTFDWTPIERVGE